MKGQRLVALPPWDILFVGAVSWILEPVYLTCHQLHHTT